MRRRLIAWCAIPVVLALIMGSSPAVAQKLPAATVATVDMRKILQTSSAAQSARSQLDERQDRYRAEIKGEEDRLRTTLDELQRQQSILAPDAYSARNREFDKQRNDVLRRTQERRREYDLAYQQAIGVIEGEVVKIVSEVSKERGFNVVLPKGQYIWAADTLDITEAVLKRLNERLPQVQMK